MHITNLIITFLTIATSTLAARKSSDAILLSKVKTLTLRDGQQTSHHRISAVPQLQCVGGNACDLYKVDVMRCTNSGSEYDTEDVAWTCKANLPKEFKLGSTEVVCEGYDSAEDPFVLKGSCGVEYRLVLTDVGEEKYREYLDSRSWKAKMGFGGGGKEWGQWIREVGFWMLFVGVIGILAYNFFFPNGNNRFGGNQGFRRGWGGGGGGGDGYDDPPPPYTPRAPKSRSTSYRSSSSRSSSSRQNQGWQPGFWTGAATGAAAGYAAGGLGRNRQQETYARPGLSSWFGGNNNAPTAGPSNWAARTSSSPPAPSSSRQESTGFGGTRRR